MTPANENHTEAEQRVLDGRAAALLLLLWLYPALPLAAIWWGQS